MAYLTGGEVDRDTLKFKSNVPSSSVSLAEEEVLLSKDRAAGIVVERERVKVPGIEDTGGGATEGGYTGGAGTGGVVVPGGEVPGPKRYKKISISSESTLKDKEKETVSQIGARVTKEVVE